MDWNFIEREMFGFSNSSSSNSDTDLVYSSAGFVEFIVEVSSSPSSSLCEEVMSLNSISLEDDWVEAF